jgi:hypothetical protein
LHMLMKFMLLPKRRRRQQGGPGCGAAGYFNASRLSIIILR